MRHNRTTDNKGYLITSSHSDSGTFIPDALHVEMDTHTWLYNNDDEAARAAQRDGVKFLYGIPYVADGVYLDTPENRGILTAYSRRLSAMLRQRQWET